MLSQLSYFPTWTPQRGVAKYVCHSPAAVKFFLRAAVRRHGERSGTVRRERAGPLRGWLRQGDGMCLRHTPKMGVGALCPCLSIAPFFLKHSPLVCRQASSSLPGTPAGKQGRSESGWHTNALTVRTQGHPWAVSSGWQPSRHAGQSSRHPRVLSFRPSPEKNRPGRPCGAWLPRKKTL